MSEKPESFTLLITKGILRDRQMRRRALLGIVAAALLLLGGGALFWDAWLMGHPLLLLLYWGACLWLTLTALLLAAYDLLALRGEARRERRRLEREILGEDGEKRS